MVLLVNEHGTFEIIDNPYIKEILEQQRIILEIHRDLVEVLMYPPMLYKTKEVKDNG